MKKLGLLFTILVLFLVANVVEAAPWLMRARIVPFEPGSDTTVEVRIKAGEEPVEYDISVQYVGHWWGGGSYPPTITYGELYWTECVRGGGCTKWFRGTIPARSHELIQIPVTTSINAPTITEYGGVVIGTIDDQPVFEYLTARVRD